MTFQQSLRVLLQHQIGSVISALLILCLSAVGGWAEEPNASSQASYVSPATVKSWMDEGQSVTLLDVREPDEFTAGHLPGASNIRYDQVASLADQLSHDQPIVLYCIHSAHRAPAAAKTLGQLGFTNAHVMEGGIVAWKADGSTIQASNLARAPAILLKTERCASVEDKTGSPTAHQ